MTSTATGLPAIFWTASSMVCTSVSVPFPTMSVTRYWSIPSKGSREIDMPVGSSTVKRPRVCASGMALSSGLRMMTSAEVPQTSERTVSMPRARRRLLRAPSHATR